MRRKDSTPGGVPHALVRGLLASRKPVGFLLSSDGQEVAVAAGFAGTPETARRFFLQYMRAINEEYESPLFYNTLMSNCTNVIWQHARVNPERVAFSWKLLASGYAPEYLYETGRLDSSLPFPELMRRAHVNPVARSLGDGEDFSRRIRGLPAAAEGTSGSEG